MTAATTTALIQITATEADDLCTWARAQRAEFIGAHAGSWGESAIADFNFLLKLLHTLKQVKARSRRANERIISTIAFVGAFVEEQEADYKEASEVGMTNGLAELFQLRKEQKLVNDKI